MTAAVSSSSSAPPLSTEEQIFRLNKDMEQAGLVSMRQSQAELNLSQTSYQTTRTVLYFLAIIVGSIGISIALKIYIIKQTFADFISWIDNTCRPDGFSAATGLQLALCINWQWYNRLFGVSNNLDFPSAVLLVFSNNKTFTAVTNSGHPGQFLNCLRFAAIEAGGSHVSTMKLVCNALCALDPAACDDQCLKPCPPPGGTTSTAMAAMHGAVSGMGAGAGVGFLFHGASAALGAAAGPLAWGSVAIGIAVNAFSSISENNKEKERQKVICETETKYKICKAHC